MDTHSRKDKGDHRLIRIRLAKSSYNLNIVKLSKVNLLTDLYNSIEISCKFQIYTHKLIYDYETTKCFVFQIRKINVYLFILSFSTF